MKDARLLTSDLKLEEVPQMTPHDDFSVCENPSFAILLVGRPVATDNKATSKRPLKS